MVSFDGYPSVHGQLYGWESDIFFLLLVENRCNRCGISESVQGLHREPNLNAAVKFRMTTNKRRTILVKLWNNSTQPRWKCGVSILYNLVTWSQGRTPGNQEHTQPTPE
jgi:hypothetical protein